MSTLNFNKNQSKPLPPQWTRRIPEGEYHRQAQRGIVVTSTMLKQFRACPTLYRAIIGGAETPERKSAFRFGRAVHKLVLEGEDAYRAEFVVGGPLNEKTGRSFSHGSRAFAHWVEECGAAPERVITPAEAHDIGCMRDAVRNHRAATEALSDGWPERCAEAGVAGLSCRARFDWLRSDGLVVDLKTTVDLGRFEADAKRFGYLNQFAFYRDVALAAGAGRVDLVAVVLEKRPPFRVGVWDFPDDILAPYAAQNFAALKSLARCREENRWPTGYEGARSFPPAGLPPLWLN